MAGAGCTSKVQINIKKINKITNWKIDSLEMCAGIDLWPGEEQPWPPSLGEIVATMIDATPNTCALLLLQR